MTIARPDFDAAFPELQATTTDATFNFWLAQAATQINASRFGAQADLVTLLFVAHNVALAHQASAPGAAASGVSGPVTSKSVGSVSKSYDAGAYLYRGAGLYNATSYGLRLYQMLRTFSAGPRYIAHPYPLARPFTGPFLR